MRFVPVLVRFKNSPVGSVFLLKKFGGFKVLWQHYRQLLNLKGKFYINPTRANQIIHLYALLLQYNDNHKIIKIFVTVYRKINLICEVPM